MKTKITLHFYLRSKKAVATGLLPLYVRLTVNGERLEFSSKKFIEKSKWSDDLSKMKGNSKEARSINGYLDSVKAQVTNIQMSLNHKRETADIEAFKKASFRAENFATINIASFSKGVYFLTIISQEQRQTQKIIVN
jgi:biopolymer transport protein ExbB/TolQ